MPSALTYKIEEFAELLGVSRGYAYNLAKTGEIAGVPVIHVGSRMVLSRALADRVLDGEDGQLPTPATTAATK